MNRKLFLHVGPSKTGTSAIQGLFRDYTPAGILYPETGRWPDGSHHKLVFAYQGKCKYGLIDIDPWQALLCSLEKEISVSSDHILISSELATLDFIAGLAPLISKFNLDFRLILVARHPVERAASLYNQGVKDPVVGINEDANAYLSKRAPELRFKPLFERWASLGKPIIVLPYQDVLPLTQRFCDALGVSMKSDIPEKYPNKSMGGAALLTVLIANKLLPSEPQRRTFFTQLQKNSSFHIWRGDSFPFDKAGTVAFYKIIKDDIDWILANFNFPKHTYPESAQNMFILSDDDVTKIYAQLRQCSLVEHNEALIEKTLSFYHTA